MKLEASEMYKMHRLWSEVNADTKKDQGSSKLVSAAYWLQSFTPADIKEHPASKMQNTDLFQLAPSIC